MSDQKITWEIIAEAVRGAKGGVIGNPVLYTGRETMSIYPNNPLFKFITEAKQRLGQRYGR